MVHMVVLSNTSIMLFCTAILFLIANIIPQGTDIIVVLEKIRHV